MTWTFFLRFEKPQELTWVAIYYYVAATGTKRKVATNIRNFYREREARVQLFTFTKISAKMVLVTPSKLDMLQLFWQYSRARIHIFFFIQIWKPHANWHVECRNFLNISSSANFRHQSKKNSRVESASRKWDLFCHFLTQCWLENKRVRKGL